MVGDEYRRRVRPIALVDVDYTIGEVGPRFGKWLKDLHESMGIRYEDLWRSDEHLAELKGRISEWLYPGAVEKLRELSRNADVVLFSELPHDLVRLVRDVLIKQGIPIRAIGRIERNIAMKRKKDFVWMLPISKRPILWIDDPYAKDNYQHILERNPHIHLIVVREMQVAIMTTRGLKILTS